VNARIITLVQASPRVCGGDIPKKEGRKDAGKGVKQLLTNVADSEGKPKENAKETGIRRGNDMQNARIDWV